MAVSSNTDIIQAVSIYKYTKRLQQQLCYVCSFFCETAVNRNLLFWFFQIASPFFRDGKGYAKNMLFCLSVFIEISQNSGVARLPKIKFASFLVSIPRSQLLYLYYLTILKGPLQNESSAANPFLTR